MNDWLPHFNRHRASRRVLMAVLITAAVSGYFMGLRQTRSQVSLTRPTELSTTQASRTGENAERSVPGIVKWQDEFKAKFNDDWYTLQTYNAIAMLAQGMAAV